MTSNPSRRDVLASSIALAAGAALPCMAHVSPAMADTGSMSAAEIVAAVRDKKITATELANAAFARFGAKMGRKRRAAAFDQDRVAVFQQRVAVG